MAADEEVFSIEQLKTQNEVLRKQVVDLKIKTRDLFMAHAIGGLCISMAEEADTTIAKRAARIVDNCMRERQG